jgi:hypothetical protein
MCRRRPRRQQARVFSLWPEKATRITVIPFQNQPLN